MTIKAFLYWRLSSEESIGKFNNKADFRLFFDTHYSQTSGNLVQRTENFQRRHF